MRRFASLGVAAVTTLALASPALVTAASAAPGSDSPVSASASAEKAKKGKLRIKRSDKGAQPGVSTLKLTAVGLGKAKGKVKFVAKGEAGKVKKSVAAKKGKAVWKVPPLGTGKYKVTATFQGKKGKTKFEIYDSALSVNTTTFTCSIGNSAARTPLSGNVKFKGKQATGGFVDIYQNGQIKGGSESPSFLGFDSIATDGSGNFDAGTGFCSQITSGSGLAGGNLAPLGVGTYSFQVYYTDDAAYENYISSNILTVNVVA